MKKLCYCCAVILLAGFGGVLMQASQVAPAKAAPPVCQPSEPVYLELSPPENKEIVGFSRMADGGLASIIVGGGAQYVGTWGSVYVENNKIVSATPIINPRWHDGCTTQVTITDNGHVQIECLNAACTSNCGLSEVQNGPGWRYTCFCCVVPGVNPK